MAHTGLHLTGNPITKKMAGKTWKFRQNPQWRKIVEHGRTNIMTPKQRLKAFKADLREVLEKHKAIIHVDCAPCSDLYGIYDERMTVSFDRDWDNEVELKEQWGISAGDL